MNDISRRAFLRFAAVAPVAVPMSAAAITAPASFGKVASTVTMTIGGLDFGSMGFGSVLSFPTSRFDRDAFAFNPGVTAITKAIDEPARLPAVLEKVVDKLGDIAVETIAKVEPAPASNQEGVT